MSCKYCNEEYENLYNDMTATAKADFNGSSGICVYVYDGKLEVEASADVYEPNYLECEVKINYCPMCGRKLEGE